MLKANITYDEVVPNPSWPELSIEEMVHRIVTCVNISKKYRGTTQNYEWRIAERVVTYLIRSLVSSGKSRLLYVKIGRKLMDMLHFSVETKLMDKDDRELYEKMLVDIARDFEHIDFYLYFWNGTYPWLLLISDGHRKRK